MAQNESSIVFHSPEDKSRGGRKRKYITIKIVPAIDAEFPSQRSEIRNEANKRKIERFPDLIKLAELPEFLCVSKSSVYRMIKNGLKTCRPTSPNGDQHVRRKDLEEYLERLDSRVRTSKR